MKVTVCIGSSCHIKGSRQVVEQLQRLIGENNLESQVELAGTLPGQMPGGRVRDRGRGVPLREP